MSDTYTDFAPLKYDQQQIAHQGYGVANAGATDNQLIVGFYPKSIVNVALSQKKGRRICETKDFVKIQHPGESLNIVDRPALPSDMARWPRQWALYQQGKEQVPDGIPVSLLFVAQPHISDMLVGRGVHTVEQLANLSADALGNIGMGAQEWSNKAKKYLAQAEKGVNVHKFERELAERDRTIATQSRQIKELSDQVARIMKLQQPPEYGNQASNFDVQTAQIAAAKSQEIFDTPPLTMSATIGGQAQPRTPRKQRSDKGKPRGPRKEA